MLKISRSPLYFLYLVSLVILIISVATSFDRFHHILELFSHFKLQYFLSSLLCLLLLLVFKQYKFAAIMSLGVGLNALYVLPWYFSAQTGIVTNQSSTYRPAENKSVEVKMMLSNVNSANQNFQALIDLVNFESPDIFVAQEVNQRWLIELQELEKTYPHHYAISREDNFGIAIYSKYPYEQVNDVYWGNSYLPSIQAVLNIAGQSVTTITTHPLPPVSRASYISRNSQIKKVAEVSKNSDNPLILIGDLNITMWSNDYDSLEWGNKLSNARKGFGILPTWPSMLPLLMIPIDHCLVSSHFIVQNIKVGKNIGSDHLPLIVKLALKV